MRLLPKSIHWCRRYPTKFNSGRDIPAFNPRRFNFLRGEGPIIEGIANWGQSQRS